MRYFLELSYCGDNYAGWQRQNNAITVQEVIEDEFSKILRETVKITGCGRTDTGVHARQFFAHLDTEFLDFISSKHRLNSILPRDISIHQIHSVEEEAHARFDAVSRQYEYHVTFEKNPFLHNRAFYIFQPEKLDFKLLQDAAKMLLEFDDFFSFCKTKTDVKTTICNLRECQWKISEKEMSLTITADRFLRGMVRLIVGMCLNVAWGKANIDLVRSQIANKQRLDSPWSVPAHGLYLDKIKYPYL